LIFSKLHFNRQHKGLFMCCFPCVCE